MNAVVGTEEEARAKGGQTLRAARARPCIERVDITQIDVGDQHRAGLGAIGLPEFLTGDAVVGGKQHGGAEQRKSPGITVGEEIRIGCRGGHENIFHQHRAGFRAI